MITALFYLPEAAETTDYLLDGFYFAGNHHCGIIDIEGFAGWQVDTDIIYFMMENKMKRLQIIILVAVPVAVLVTVLGVGLYIREARQRNKAVGSKADVNSAGKLSGEGLETERERFHRLSEEERTKLTEERKKRAERWANMSEEEKEKFRELIRKRANAKGEGLPGASNEEGATLREKWVNMSEQEREQLRIKLRERSSRQEPNVVQEEPNAVREEPNVIQ